MDQKDLDSNRTKAGSQLIVRILATGAVWSIAIVMGLRLQHRLIALTLAGVAAAVSILIWTQPNKK